MMFGLNLSSFAFFASSITLQPAWSLFFYGKAIVVVGGAAARCSSCLSFAMCDVNLIFEVIDHFITRIHTANMYVSAHMRHIRTPLTSPGITNKTTSRGSEKKKLEHKSGIFVMPEEKRSRDEREQLKKCWSMGRNSIARPENKQIAWRNGTHHQSNQPADRDRNRESEENRWKVNRSVSSFLTYLLGVLFPSVYSAQRTYDVWLLNVIFFSLFYAIFVWLLLSPLRFPFALCTIAFFISFFFGWRMSSCFSCTQWKNFVEFDKWQHRWTTLWLNTHTNASSSSFFSHLTFRYIQHIPIIRIYFALCVSFFFLSLIFQLRRQKFAIINLYSLGRLHSFMMRSRCEFCNLWSGAQINCLELRECARFSTMKKRNGRKLTPSENVSNCGYFGSQFIFSFGTDFFSLFHSPVCRQDFSLMCHYVDGACFHFPMLLQRQKQQKYHRWR